VYRKTSGSQNTIGGVGDIIECIEQRAVEIKDDGAKRHVYRDQRSRPTEVMGVVSVRG
jgi:nicotinic acid phosphoribosyltransferase